MDEVVEVDENVWALLADLWRALYKLLLHLHRKCFAMVTKPRKRGSIRAAILQRVRSLSSQSDKAGGIPFEALDEASSEEEAFSDDDPATWVLKKPELRGFVLELLLGDKVVAVRPNATVPLEFENEFFKGRLLFMLETDPKDPTHAAYMSTGKPRRFEMQCQGALKREPSNRGGILQMGAELSERPKLSMITTTLVRAVMSFVQRRTAGLEWSLGSRGGEERPYCAFPLTTGVDALCASKTGEEAPKLGAALPEPEEVRAKRRAGEIQPTLHNDGTTYSFSLFSGFVDFTNWKVTMPVGSPLLSDLVGEQPIDVVVYDYDPLNNKKKRYWLRFRLRWDPDLAHAAREAAQRKLHRSVRREERRLLSKKKQVFVAPTVIDETLFVTTGDYAALSIGPLTRGGCDCIAESRGYAVLREVASPAPFRLVRESISKDDNWRTLVGAGEVVRLQSFASKQWLTAIRGHYLAWKTRDYSDSDSKLPKPKDCELFVVQGLNQGDKLKFGQEFTLRSARWPELCVALAEGASSAKYGGRLLRLRQFCDGSVVPLSFTATRSTDEVLASRLSHTMVIAEAMRSSEQPSVDLLLDEAKLPPSVTIDSVRVHGWCELVDRATMRMARCYILVAEYSVSAGGPKQRTLRLRTAQELAAALGVHAAELAIGRGGRCDAVALKRARRLALREERPRRMTAAGSENMHRAATKAREGVSKMSIVASERALALGTKARKAILERAEAERPKMRAMLSSFLNVKKKTGEDNPLDSSSRNSNTTTPPTSPPKDDEEAASEFSTVAKTTLATQLSTESSSSAEDLRTPRTKKATSARNSLDELFDDSEDEDSGDELDEEAGKSSKLSKDFYDEAESPTRGESPTTIPFDDGEDPETDDEEPAPLKRDPPDEDDARVWIGSSSYVRGRPPYHRAPADVAVDAIAKRLSALVEASRLERRRSSSELEKEEDDVPPSSPRQQLVFDSRLREMVARPSPLEPSFLRGGACEIGVDFFNLGRTTTRGGGLPGGDDQQLGTKVANPEGCCVVARALGEGHWAEQLAVIRFGRLDFLEPFAFKGATPALALPLYEIIGKVRSLEMGSSSTSSLPFPVLVIETLGRCHYLGFASSERRDRWEKALALARACSAPADHAPAVHQTKSSSVEAFVLKPMAYRGERLILNARRLGFDVVDPRGGTIPSITMKPWELSVALLRQAYALSPDADAREMTTLFDAAAALRALPLTAITADSPTAALCFFLNLHHAMLQHALLVLGPPKRSSELAAFSASISYDCLGDVFSLNELACCVLRGRLYGNLRDAEPFGKDDLELNAPTTPTSSGPFSEHEAQSPTTPATSSSNRPLDINCEEDKRTYFSKLASRTNSAKNLIHRSNRKLLSSMGAGSPHSPPPLEPTAAQEAPPLALPPAAPTTTAHSRPSLLKIPSTKQVRSLAEKGATMAAKRGSLGAPPFAHYHPRGVAQWGWPQPPAPPKSDEHWELGLAAADCRVALALNIGSTDFPRTVEEFTPEGLNLQLNNAAARFLEQPGAIIVDEQRRVVTLPAPCELLRSSDDDVSLNVDSILLEATETDVEETDTAQAARDVLRTCLRFLGKRQRRQLSNLLLPSEKENAPLTVRFRPPSAKLHESLSLAQPSGGEPLASSPQNEKLSTL